MYAWKLSTAERHAMISKIKGALSAATVDDVVTFEAMSRSVGTDVREFRYLVYTAMKALNKELGIVFESVRGEGYKRLPSDSVHMVGSSARKRIRGAAMTAQKRIVNVVKMANHISPEAMRKANAELSSLGLLEALSAPRFTAELEKKAAEDFHPVGPRIVTEEFLRHIGVDGRFKATNSP